MSVELKFEKGKAIATFTKDVKENEITNAFIEITETVSIKKLRYIILDFSAIDSYIIPKNHIATLKMITHFSSTWNTNINVIVIATNTEIRTVINGIIKNSKEFKWSYLLFDDLETVNNFLKQN